MKTKENLRLRQVGPKYMIVRVDAAQVNLTEVYTLNHTAAALWRWAQGRDFTADEMADHLCRLYEVEACRALEDTRRLLQEWRAYGLLADH